MTIDKQNLHSNELGDELYTFDYTVDFLVKHLEQNSTIKKADTILCPFSSDWSAFYRVLKMRGYNVVISNKNFFDIDEAFIQENNISYIIDNPPFSIKDKVLLHSFNLNRPFIYILPLDALGGSKRHKMFDSFKSPLQALIPDKRLKFITPKHKTVQSNPVTFHSIFVSNGAFKNNLITDFIVEYENDNQTLDIFI